MVGHHHKTYSCIAHLTFVRQEKGGTEGQSAVHLNHVSQMSKVKICCNLGLTGTGMSEPELQRNPVLTDYTVRDLNKDPKLPYEDNTFDVITNVVSVDYLNRPLVSHFNF